MGPLWSRIVRDRGEWKELDCVLNILPIFELSFAEVMNQPRISYFLHISVISLTGSAEIATSPLFANKITGMGFPFGSTTFDLTSASH